LSREQLCAEVCENIDSEVLSRLGRGGLNKLIQISLKRKRFRILVGDYDLNYAPNLTPEEMLNIATLSAFWKDYENVKVLGGDKTEAGK